MQCPQCGTFLNPSEFRADADGNPLCPFCGVSVRGQSELFASDAVWQIPETRSDIPGVISIVCGILSLLCLPMICFTCGMSLFVGTPLAIVGIICGFRGTGVYRAAGLLMNFIAFLPSVVIGGFFVVGNLAGKSDPPFELQPPATESIARPMLVYQSYQPLYHPTRPGSAFHFTSQNRRYVACSLSQFQGQPPTELRSREFQESIVIRDQVHKQQDVQILTYDSVKLDNIAPLTHDGADRIVTGESVALRINDKTLTGTLIGRAPHELNHWQFRVPEAIHAANSQGAPVMSTLTGKVIGVVVASPVLHHTLIVTFEPLTIPEKLP